MADKLAWDFVVLHPLRDGNPTHLKTIYAAIGEGLKEGGYINPKLFKVDGRWGDDRPDYTHVVRSTMSSLKKRGLVERLSKGKRTGVYRITDDGLKELSRIEP
ncbi:MAG: hypothetical protein H8D32_00430 [Dehalococcoidia bacterium]|nr:hypothetical protein [Dehalococcoidia bacterium]